MKSTAISLEDLHGVFSVSPLARNNDETYSINFEQNEHIIRHITDGGITRFLYGGNAFLYHISLADYKDLLSWMNSQNDEWWMIPSAGPSFGRAMDQAPLLRAYEFPAVMLLPCSDPMDAKGLDKGLRIFAKASQKKLILYIKTENSLGSEEEAGIDMLGRLIDDGICVAIKYAIPRIDPSKDPYLDLLLQRINVNRVVSGIGERPAIVHMSQFNMPGFTTGSGCVQPRLCSDLYEACKLDKKEKAETLRKKFLPLEDLRDAWSPALVLHYAMALSEISDTGPILPFLSALTTEQLNEIKPVAESLAKAHFKNTNV